MPSNLQMEVDTYENLVKISLLQLCDEIPNGLTTTQFDEWLNELTNDHLDIEVIRTVHAIVYDLFRSMGPHLWTEAESLLNNRISHSIRAINTLRREEIVSTRAEMKDAYPGDKFMQTLVETGLNIDAHQVSILMAIAQRGKTSESCKEIYEEAETEGDIEDFPSFEQAIVAGNMLTSLTVTNLKESLAVNKAKLEEAQKHLADIKRLKDANDLKDESAKNDLVELMNDILGKN